MESRIDAEWAADRIERLVDCTPLFEIRGAVHLKLENTQQVVGGFKVRGAASAMTLANPGKGVMTSALGTHGFAVGYVGKQLGIETACMMIQNPPEAARRKMEALVDEVLYGADTLVETEPMARAYAAEHDMYFCHPYNDWEVISGQGTIALEIFEELPSVDRIYVPIGGGGLISGIAYVAKSKNPNIRIIGVQPENMHAMVASVRAGRVVEVPQGSSVAEKLSVNLAPDTVTYGLVCKYVDDLILISEDGIRAAMDEISNETGTVVEGAGAVAYAACMQDGGDSVTSVCIVSGGNA